MDRAWTTGEHVKSDPQSVYFQAIAAALEPIVRAITLSKRTKVRGPAMFERFKAAADKAHLSSAFVDSLDDIADLLGGKVSHAKSFPAALSEDMIDSLLSVLCETDTVTVDNLFRSQRRNSSTDYVHAYLPAIVIIAHLFRAGINHAKALDSVNAVPRLITLARSYLTDYCDQGVDIDTPGRVRKWIRLTQSVQFVIVSLLSGIRELHDDDSMEQCEHFRVLSNMNRRYEFSIFSNCTKWLEVPGPMAVKKDLFASTIWVLKERWDLPGGEVRVDSLAGVKGIVNACCDGYLSDFPEKVRQPLFDVDDALRLVEDEEEEDIVVTRDQAFECVNVVGQVEALNFMKGFMDIDIGGNYSNMVHDVIRTKERQETFVTDLMCIASRRSDCSKAPNCALDILLWYLRSSQVHKNGRRLSPTLRKRVLRELLTIWGQNDDRTSHLCIEELATWNCCSIRDIVRNRETFGPKLSVMAPWMREHFGIEGEDGDEDEPHERVGELSPKVFMFLASKEFDESWRKAIDEICEELCDPGEYIRQEVGKMFKHINAAASFTKQFENGSTEWDQPPEVGMTRVLAQSLHTYSSLLAACPSLARHLDEDEMAKCVADIVTTWRFGNVFGFAASVAALERDPTSADLTLIYGAKRALRLNEAMLKVYSKFCDDKSSKLRRENVELLFALLLEGKPPSLDISPTTKQGRKALAKITATRDAMRKAFGKLWPRVVKPMCISYKGYLAIVDQDFEMKFFERRRKGLRSENAEKLPPGFEKLRVIEVHNDAKFCETESKTDDAVSNSSATANASSSMSSSSASASSSAVDSESKSQMTSGGARDTGDTSVRAKKSTKTKKLFSCTRSSCNRKEERRKEFKMCALCPARYCSDECAKLDWKQHKKTHR